MFGIVDERSFINSAEFKKYKDFAFKNDVLKLSVGVILGSSFNKVVQGISDCLIMPVVSFMISKTSGGWRDIEFVPINGLKFEVGKLSGVFVDFFVVSLVLYILYIKVVEKLSKKDSIKPPEQTKIPQKQCPHCLNQVHAEATKCYMCTGSLIVKKRRAGVKDKGTKSSRGKQKRTSGNIRKNRNDT
jgi:large conductance mechanosensitive channel